MTDDIVTRLREHANGDYEKTADFMLGLAADEIERLRLTLHEVASHHSTQNAEQLRIVRAVEADRDHWRSIAELAVDNADQAVKLLQKLTGVGND